MRPHEQSLPILEAQFLKSGEFAQFCSTAKDALRHYRQIGLLEPISVSKSGYAPYSSLQVSTFVQ